MSATNYRLNLSSTLLVVILLCACAGPKGAPPESKTHSNRSSSTSSDEESILRQINENHDDRQKLHLLSQLADLRAKKKTDSQTTELIEQIMQLSRKLYGNQSIEFAEALSKQGTLLFQEKDFAHSAQSWQEAGVIYTAHGENFAKQQMDCVSGEIAGSCATGKCSDNSALYEKLLSLRRKCLGNQDQQTMISAMLLAEVYSKQQKYEKALTLFKEVYAWSLTRGPMEETPAAINLARAYIYLKNYKEAGILLDKSLDYAEKHPLNGLINPSLISALKAELLLFDEEKQYDKSLHVAKRILDLNEKQMGPTHPQLTSTLMIYAEALDKVGKTKESASVKKRIRSIEMAPTPSK